MSRSESAKRKWGPVGQKWGTARVNAWSGERAVGQEGCVYDWDTRCARMLWLPMNE